MPTSALRAKGVYNVTEREAEVPVLLRVSFLACPRPLSPPLSRPPPFSVVIFIRLSLGLVVSLSLSLSLSILISIRHG